MKIKDSHVLITGANRGIGKALALMCAQEKAHIMLVIRKDDPQLAEELTANGAASVKTFIADLGSRSSVDELIQKLKSQTVDILINNAGQLTGGLIEDQNIDEIYSMFQVNLLSLIQLTRGVIPQMIAQKRGLIINNSSVSAIMHFPCASTYAASKAALLAFNNCIHLELKETGVKTLCLITPGIKTRMFDEIAVKYGKNLEVPSDFISTDEYANKIKQAIYSDEEYLYPTGATAWGLRVARYLPGLFQKAAQAKFKRNSPN